MIEAAVKAKEQHANQLLVRKNVVGVAVGYKETGGERTSTPAVTVLVETKLPPSCLSPHNLIPQSVGGVPTDVIEVGSLTAPPPRVQSDGVWTDRYDPTPPGVSIGHKDITAGTFGCVVRRSGAHYILSNNHVLACSNAAKLGDEIIQPGPYDGGTFTLAHLADYVPIHFATSGATCALLRHFITTLNLTAKVLGSSHRLGGYKLDSRVNKVDAAIALPALPEDITYDIIDGIGTPTGIATPALDTEIQKCGRTTGHTYGTIKQVHATVQVSYGFGRYAIFRDQFITGPMSAGGDSGSSALTLDAKVVGLLFAGSDRVTIFSPIQEVMHALKVEVVT